MGVHGYASAERPPDADPAGSSSSSDKRICLAVVTELCPHGNLEDFMAAEGAPLSAAVKLDVMLQVAQGLDQLKEARIVWRDLKAKNLSSERRIAAARARLFAWRSPSRIGAQR